MRTKVTPFLIKLSRYELLTKSITALLTIVIPAVAGWTYKIWLDSPEGKSKDQALTVLLTLVGAQLVLAILNLIIPSSAPGAVATMTELAERLEEQEANLASAEGDRDAQVAMNLMLGQALANLQWLLMEQLEKDPDEWTPLKDAYDILLGQIEEDADLIFGFSDKELHNFAVYIFDRKQDRLVAKWRRHHRKLLTTGLGRTWRSGRGHVGLCHDRQSILITEDLTRGSLWDGTEQDKRQYLAAAAAPFFVGSECIGVFVATSNKPGRFGSDNKDDPKTAQIWRFFEAISNLLTVYHTYSPLEDENGGDDTEAKGAEAAAPTKETAAGEGR